jgi:KDO2-lipid IV(A) lauroyltransferase
MIGELKFQDIFIPFMKAFQERLYYLNPLTWLTWLILSCLWLITRLPCRWQIQLGFGLGKIIYAFSPKLKYITETNLALCFPDLTPADRTALCKKNFESLGAGIIETAMAWWVSDKRLQKCQIEVTGIEFVEEAYTHGKGIILLSPHAMCLEMVGRLIGARYSFAAMYRPHKIPAVAKIQERFRQKYRIKHIARHRMREVMNTFRDNMAVWYAYDIDAGEKRSVFAPFFGIQTASLTAVSRLVELTGARIVPVEFFRRDDCWGYTIKAYAELKDFPGENRVADATRLNAHLEQAIRNKPEQYIWQYKRFKTRPAGETRFY